MRAPPWVGQAGGWVAAAGGPVIPTMTTYDLERAMMHELGHALGLNHPVTGGGQPTVMECHMNPGEPAQFYSDDWNAVHYLYVQGNYGSPGSSPC